MKHICSKCNTEKDTSEFRPNKCRKNGYQAYCIICDKKFQAEWYQKNKKKCISKAKVNTITYKQAARDYVISILRLSCCTDCGEKDIVVLDFDHKSDKKYNISKMVLSGHSIEKIQNEIDKCEIRCANCHRRKTAKQFNWYKLKLPT